MRFVSADEIDGTLTLPDLIEALHAAFSAEAVIPDRHHHGLAADPGSPVHLLMPAWTADAPAPGSFLGTKIVNVFPGNAVHGLPAVLGTYLLFAGDTGRPLVTIDGTRLTHWRTAAASGLAARLLARPEARHLVMVGAGALAPFLMRAHAAVRPIDRITLWNHRRDSAERLAAAHPALPITIADDLPRAVASADIVSCATLSRVALVEGAWLRPGTHVDLVGAFAPGMREVDDTALQRAALFVDTWHAMSEGGDVAAALATGAITPAAVRGTLSDLCRGTLTGRPDQETVTVFKSVGTALEDLAAAMLIWRHLA